MSQIETNFRKYLYRIAYWKTLDFFKKRKLKTVWIGNDGDSQITSNDSDTLEQIEADEVRETLQLLLQGLSYEEKNLAVLHYYERLTYLEIADIIFGEKLKDNERLKKATLLRKRLSRINTKLKETIKSKPSLKELLEI